MGESVRSTSGLAKQVLLTAKAVSLSGRFGSVLTFRGIELAGDGGKQNGTGKKSKT